MLRLVIGATKPASMARVVDEGSMGVASKGKAMRSSEESRVRGRGVDNSLEYWALSLGSVVEGIMTESDRGGECMLNHDVCKLVRSEGWREVAGGQGDSRGGSSSRCKFRVAIVIGEEVMAARSKGFMAHIKRNKSLESTGISDIAPAIKEEQELHPGNGNRRAENFRNNETEGSRREAGGSTLR